MTNGGKHLYEFGPFSLDPQERLLRREGLPISLPPKAFDTLVALVQNPGHLLPKDELMKIVWPDTFVEESNLALSVSVLRKALGDSAQEPRFILTVPGKGYRFAAPVRQTSAGFEASAIEAKPGSEAVVQEQPEGSPTVALDRRHLLTVKTALLAILIAGGITLWLWYSHRPLRLTEKDTILLADIENHTGDPAFDDVLRQGLAIQLDQSPFLDVLPDQRVRAMLPLLGLHHDERLTGEAARGVCLRTGSKVMITGSVSSLGSQYVVDLGASICQTGDTLTQEQVVANRKEDVLKALGEASTKLRAQLGESLQSIEKFNVPIQDATTPSLEAFKSFTAGIMTMYSDPKAAIPLFQRAIELDSNFARGYMGLGAAHINLGEYQQGAQMIKRAYILRDRVSEPEKFLINFSYYSQVTGNLDKAGDVLAVWARTYPRQHLVHLFLANNYALRGLYPEALAEAQEALRRAPVPNGIAYDHLMSCYIALDQLDQAAATYADAQAHGVDNYYLHLELYKLAFLQGDGPGMVRQIEWSHASEAEDSFLAMQADTEAFRGCLAKARELTRQAVTLARAAHRDESAAEWQLSEALREAEFGNFPGAKNEASSALQLSSARDVRILAALAYARSGEWDRARSLVDALTKEFPEDTVFNQYWLPAIRAAIDLGRGHADKALEFLAPAGKYELGSPSPLVAGTLYPIYLRAQADLAAGHPTDAASEFTKILDHPGITLNLATGVLARLGLAQCYAAQGEKNKARTAYEQFLALFKEADRNVPVLKTAQSEYDRLR
jgi:eukaryotic-like serine/threonine-protein kinase